MYILLTYDISTETVSGQKRLAKVAKTCEKYGVRVQNSVFEINIDSAHLLSLKDSLSSIIDDETDSIRIYKLGKTYTADLTILGKRQVLEPAQDNILDL